MSGSPDSPEAVALRLLEMVLEREEGGERRRNDRRRAENLLDLYAECLVATNGNRQIAHGALLN